MILPCEIPQLDIPDVGRNHILEFFLVPVREIISVPEIYSDSFFIKAIRNFAEIAWAYSATIQTF